MYNHCQLPRKRQYNYYKENMISIAALYYQLSNDSSEYHACQDVNYQTEQCENPRFKFEESEGQHQIT